ncbi:MAG: hypothetical protein HOO95_10295 [Gallionella sp.]|nr:hypothetical protein [Gallionella sp.]
MKIKVLVFALLISFPFIATANDCDLSTFPDFWSDAQEQVSRIEQLLSSEEKQNTYSSKSVKAFRQSLSVCEAQRKFVYDDPTANGNGGLLTQYKCEALLMCTRLSVLNKDF